MSERYLGIDIGGTKCAVLLGNSEMEILDKIVFPTRVERGYRAIINEMIEKCEDIIKKHDVKENVRTIGISCGGPLDDRLGVIYSPPNLPDWDCVPIVKILEDRLGIPAYIQNDANACAMAEWKYGAGKGTRNMIFLTFGTGLGAGLILDGKLYSGTNGMAGEVGHIRLAEEGPVGFGKEGSFEGFCSGGGIKRLCEIMAKEECYKGMTAAEVFGKASEGDLFAGSVVERCAEYLGRGLSILVDILNPERIVIGSIFVRGEHLLREKMQEVLNKESIAQSNSVCEVVPAQLGESVGDMAALTVAIYNDTEK